MSRAQTLKIGRTPTTPSPCSPTTPSDLSMTAVKRASTSTGSHCCLRKSLWSRAGHKREGKSVRTGAYTETEDKLICEAWMTIEQDPKIGVEQKGTTFW